ncbi:MAG: hypothetical protein ACI4R8_00030 [Candidatus Caccovivens sp.]
MKPTFSNNSYLRTMNAYNYDELLQVISSGKWFKNGDFDFYYRAIPYSGELPENVVLLEMRCNTIKRVKHQWFYKISKSNYSQNLIYSGKNLESFMCERMKQWALNMNPKTLRAFAGRSFKSYLNAIPRDLLNEEFVEKLNKSLEEGFVKRIKSMPLSEESQLEDVKQMVQKSRDLFKDIVVGNAQSKDEVDTNKKQKFDDAIKTTQEIFAK